MQRYAAFVATKRGLAQASSPATRRSTACPDISTSASGRRSANATAAGVVRTDIDDLLSAVASLCMSARNARPGEAERTMALLVDGMHKQI